MRYILISLLFFLSTASFSQSLILNSGVGYSIGKMPGMRKIMLYSGGDLAREFKITEFYKIDVGIGGYTLKFSYADSSDINVFNKKLYVTIPVSVKKNYFINRRSNAFIELGILNSFLGYDKKEFYYPGDTKTIKTNSGGYNMALLLNIGFRTTMSRNGYFTVKLGSTEIIFSSYTNEALKIKHNTMLLGICFERKLK